MDQEADRKNEAKVIENRHKVPNHPFSFGHADDSHHSSGSDEPKRRAESHLIRRGTQRDRIADRSYPGEVPCVSYTRSGGGQGNLKEDPDNPVS
jgi:hypothetical protein